MSFAIKTSDSFARTGNLNGSTLDNALGGSEVNTWTDTTTPPWAAASGSATVAAPNSANCWIASSAPVVDCRLTATLVTAGNVILQIRGTGAGAIILYANSSRMEMYGGGFSGNSAGAYANGDVFALEGIGTAITVYRNGTVVFTGTANSAAAGYPGIGTGGNLGTPKISMLKYETVLIAPMRGMSQAVHRAAFI